MAKSQVNNMRKEDRLLTDLDKARIRNKALKEQWKRDGANAGPRFELKFIAHGSYVRIVWDREEESRWSRKRNREAFKFHDRKWASVNYARGMSSIECRRGDHPYSSILNDLTGKHNHWYEAYKMLVSTPDGTRIDGWMKTSMPFEEQETGPTTLHLWVNLATGKCVDSRDVPFFGYYLDYVTPNGIC